MNDSCVRVTTGGLVTDVKKRILIVDDMRTLQMILQVYLVGKFYEFAFAATGEAGWEKVRSFAPDLIISDIAMPEVSGIELCRRVRADLRSHQIPVILISSSLGEEEVRSQAMAAGASEVMAKPVDPKLLVELVEKLLELSETGSAASKG